MQILAQLQEIIPLAAQATAGPWAVKTNGNTVQSHAIEGVCSGMSTKNGNAAFIAAARNLLTPQNLTQLVAALAEPVVDWVEVAVRLPEAGVYVVLHDETSRNTPASAYYDATKWRNRYTTYSLNSFTHWLYTKPFPDTNYV